MDNIINENKMLKEEIEKLKKTIKSMEKDVRWLGCLEAAGVDNWSGYDFAHEIREERYGNTDDD